LTTSPEGQKLLSLSYDAKMSDNILARLIAIIKEPGFSPGIYIFYFTFIIHKSLLICLNIRKTRKKPHPIA
jgi:hypothetical protein